jgi:hypothetical protein
MKLICGECKAIVDDWKEMAEHKAEAHPAVKREALREYDTSKIDYQRSKDVKAN